MTQTDTHQHRHLLGWQLQPQPTPHRLAERGGTLRQGARPSHSQSKPGVETLPRSLRDSQQPLPQGAGAAGHQTPEARHPPSLPALSSYRHTACAPPQHRTQAPSSAGPLWSSRGRHSPLLPPLAASSPGHLGGPAGRPGKGWRGDPAAEQAAFLVCADTSCLPVGVSLCRGGAEATQHCQIRV